MTYNSRTVYAKVTKMPFRALGKFHPYLDERSKKIFLQLAKDTETKGRGEWENLRRRVRDYAQSGPLGSQDPILPVDVKDLHAKLNDGESGLDKKWGKRDLHKWFNMLNDTEPKFAHSRRAVETLSRIRQPGGNCLRCSRIRTIDLGKNAQSKRGIKAAFRRV